MSALEVIDASGSRSILETMALLSHAVWAASDSSKDDPAGADPSRPRTRSPHSLAGVRVIVVDDDVDARELLGALLEGADAEVAIAATADEALALVKSGGFDLLISDIGMPDRDGYDLIQDVRALSPGEGGGIPAVAFTAFARAEDRARSLRAGFQGHITKPVDVETLVPTLVSVLAPSD